MDNLEKRDTISMISHELRTSLTANKWVLKMLFDGDLGEITNEQKVFLDKALQNNDKMIELITELVEAGHAKEPTRISFEKIDVRNIVEEVVKDFSADAKKRNIILENKTKNLTPVLAEVNKNKIHSALQELVNNALKYTDKGHVSIDIATQPHGMIVFRVEDTGIGIPKDEQKKIFEKFFRGKDAQQRNEIGSGLGLFTVQKIAEKHGGKLTFTSEPGKGSIFCLEVPAHQSV